MAAAVALVGLAGCGSGSTGLPAAGPSAPSAAGPIDPAAPGWPALLHGPSHFGVSTAVGPRTARVRWRRALGAPIVPGPVVTADGTAYVATDNGILHAIAVATGADRWTFDGGAGYGTDLSTAPLVLADGEVVWPGPRRWRFSCLL